MGKPIILLAAGLGTTRDSFGKLGISRFSEDCVTELSALSKASERLVIEDWIKKEGRGQGDPTAWIDAISQETHGWPRHVHSYAKHASEYLKANKGVMNPDGLSTVLKAGHNARRAYYEGRVYGFEPDQVQCLAGSIPDGAVGHPIPRLKIMSALGNKYDDGPAQDLFMDFVNKGIIEKRGLGYAIPIPSMHTWLRDTYAMEN